MVKGNLRAILNCSCNEICCQLQFPHRLGYSSQEMQSISLLRTVPEDFQIDGFCLLQLSCLLGLDPLPELFLDLLGTEHC